MKKFSYLTTALVSLGFTSIVNASNTGTTYFVGSVSETTCSIVTVQNGVEGIKVDVGTYTKAEVEKGNTRVVNFDLKALDSSGGACSPTDSVDISWVPSSAVWAAGGLKNTGTASGVAVKLMDKDGNAFNAANFSVNYKEADLPTASSTAMMPFQAQMVQNGSDTVAAGTVISSAIFSVSYK